MKDEGERVNRDIGTAVPYCWIAMLKLFFVHSSSSAHAHACVCFVYSFKFLYHPNISHLRKADVVSAETS